MSLLPPLTSLDGLPRIPIADALPRLSAFDAPGGAAASGPGGMGQLAVDLASSFQARAAQMQSAVQALATGAGPATLGVGAASPTASVAAAGSFAPMEQQRALGVLLEVFDFAVQSELVSRAATTFTSSVNTLIKTQ